MKLFHVEAKNEKHWVSDGAIDLSFYVIAEDLMGAMVKAEEALTDLKERLGPAKSEGLRLRKLSETGDVVDDVVHPRPLQMESWAENAAKRIKDKEAD